MRTYDVGAVNSSQRVKITSENIGSDIGIDQQMETDVHADGIRSRPP